MVFLNTFIPQPFLLGNVVLIIEFTNFETFYILIDLNHYGRATGKSNNKTDILNSHVL